MITYTLPPPIPSTNITVIESYIASGLITKIPGTNRLYRCSLAPGLLLVGLARWDQVAKCSGTMVLATYNGKRGIRFAVDALSPMISISKVVNGAGLVYVPSMSRTRAECVRSRVVTHMDPGTGNTIVDSDDTLVEMDFTETVVPGPAYDCVFGVITGATYGSFANFGAADYVGPTLMFVELKRTGMLFTAGDLVLPGEDLKNGVTWGSLTTGIQASVQTHCENMRSTLAADVPGSLQGRFNDCYDAWLRENWIMSRSMISGLTTNISGAPGGAFSFAAYGDRFWKQSANGIDFATGKLPHTQLGITGPDNYYFGARKLVYFVDSTHSYGGNAIAYHGNVALDATTQVWAKAQFLADENLSLLPPLTVANIDDSVPGSLMDYSAVDTTDTDPLKVEANFVKNSTGMEYLSRVMESKTAVGQVIDSPDLFNSMSAAVFDLNKRLRKSCY